MLIDASEAGSGWTDVAEAVRVRRRFVEEGLDAALERKARARGSTNASWTGRRKRG